MKYIIKINKLMETIYKKLPQEIQSKIDFFVRNNIKKYIIPNLHIQIKGKRKNNITKSFYIQGNNKNLLYRFYYWIVIPDKDDSFWNTGYNNRTYYKTFFKKLFPSITDLSTINKVYEHYYNITNKDINSFLNLCINNISIEQAEDLYNYTLFTYYLTKINYSPLSIKNEK